MDASGMKPGDNAGLCAFQSNYCRIGVVVAEDGARYLTGVIRIPPQRRFGPQRQQPEQPQGNGETEVMRIPLTQDKVWLRIDYIFTPQEGDKYGADTAFMSWSLDGESWTQLPDTLQMRYTLDLFTGYRSALYNYSTRSTGGYADFDYFHQLAY